MGWRGAGWRACVPPDPFWATPGQSRALKQGPGSLPRSFHLASGAVQNGEPSGRRLGGAGGLHMQAIGAAWAREAPGPLPAAVLEDGPGGRTCGAQGASCLPGARRAPDCMAGSLLSRPALPSCLQAPKGKKVAAAPSAVKKAAAPAKPVNPLYEKRPKTFSACRRRLLALLLCCC